MPMVGEWSVPKHSGLKEFIDHAISITGRNQLKPSTQRLRGVATYPKGDMIQGRYAMALADLGIATEHLVCQQRRNARLGMVRD